MSTRSGAREGNADRLALVTEQCHRLRPGLPPPLLLLPCRPNLKSILRDTTRPRRAAGSSRTIQMSTAIHVSFWAPRRWCVSAARRVHSRSRWSRSSKPSWACWSSRRCCINGTGRSLVDRGVYGACCRPPFRQKLTFRRLFDVSKQVVGQMFVHGVNVLISGVVSHHTSNNACVSYFLNILIDTTLGTLPPRLSRACPQAS